MTSRDRWTVGVLVAAMTTVVVCGVPPAQAGFHKKAEKAAKGAVDDAKEAAEGVKDAASNPGRSAECAKGDTKVVREIARRTVKYAEGKWKIGDLTSDAAVRTAEQEMYEFFKWKLGNPTAVCGQYITAGYDHFKQAYGDEAAAALLGFDLPNEKDGHSEFFLPKELVELRLAIQKAAIPAAAMALEKAYGIPALVSRPLLNAYVEAEAKVLKRAGINIPKKYDFPNGLVKLTVDARRNPEKTRAALQRQIDDAVGTAGAKPPALGARR